MRELSLKKFFLHLFIASISISGLLGIVVIIIGNFGDLETRVLLTTFTVACTSILGLACGACLEAKRGRLIPILGISFSVLSAVFWIVVIWVDLIWSDRFGRIVMSTTVLATAFSHLSLILMARLEAKFRWAVTSVFISVAALVSLTFGLIWAGRTFEIDLVFRAMGVLSIITAMLTLVIPVFHRLSDNVSEAEAIEAEIEKLRMRISELEIRREKVSN